MTPDGAVRRRIVNVHAACVVLRRLALCYGENVAINMPCSASRHAPQRNTSGVNEPLVRTAHLFNACGAFFESGSRLGSRSTIDCTSSLYVRHHRRLVFTAHVANQLSYTEILQRRAVLE